MEKSRFKISGLNAAKMGEQVHYYISKVKSFDGEGKENS